MLGPKLIMPFALAAMHCAASTSKADERSEPQRLRLQSTQFASASARVAPATVTIQATQGPRQLPGWKNRSLDRIQSSRAGGGTGIVVDVRGYVLTCYHVVADADRITVRLPSGQKCEVLEVLPDPATDLAVLRVSVPADIAVADFGDSGLVKVGDWVLSVTSPYGLQGTVSAGVVGAIDREVPGGPTTRLIQTDAASNPGSSGGPLVDLDGKVVGICEGSYGTSEGFHGISFAIPANLAMNIARQLIELGAVPRGYVGCVSQHLTPSLAASLGVAEASGVVLTEITANSPAAAAGLQVGDVVTHFAGVQVHNSDEMQVAVEHAIPGKTYSIRLLREGEQITSAVVVARLPLPLGVGQPISAESASPETGLHDPLLGLRLEEMSNEVAAQFGYIDIEGVLITYVTPRTPADIEGLAAGMLIRRLGDERIRSIGDYQRAMALLRGKDRFAALVSAPEGSHFVSFQIARPRAATGPSTEKRNSPAYPR